MTTKRSNVNISFWDSLRAFIDLSNQGFRISFHKNDLVYLETYRFFWNGEEMEQMPDIDSYSPNKYLTIINGHGIKLRSLKNE